MWQMVKLLVKDGASWTLANVKGQSAPDLMQQFSDASIERAEKDFGMTRDVAAACTTEESDFE